MASKDKGPQRPVPPPASAPVESVTLLATPPQTAAPGVSPGVSDPDRIVAKVEIGAVTADVTQRDIARAVSNGYRRQLTAMVHAQRLAAAVADGLLSIAEVPDSRRLDVTIELRRRGDLPRVSE